jgi:hypothetical protein
MRMGLIYSRAVKVLAWLGPEAENSTSAMNRLGNLNSALAEVSDNKPIRDLFKGHTGNASVSLSQLFRRCLVETYLCM